MYCLLKRILPLLIIIPFWSIGQVKDSSEIVTYYYENGQKSSEGPLRNGKPDGYWKSYYRNGVLKTEGNRKDHLLDGPWKFYNDQGDLTVVIRYKADMKQGVRETYADGILIREEPYENDKKDGLARYYYDTGELQKIIPFQEGKEAGQGYEFDRNGKIITLMTFKSGVLVKQQNINRLDRQNQKQGLWMDFYEGTYTLRYEGTYLNDLKHGYWKYYLRNGNLQRIEKWVNGVLQEDAKETEKIDVRRTIDPNTGKLQSIGAYRNGKKEGVHRQYDEAGNVISSGLYEDDILLAEGILDEQGRKQGMWKFYYPDGSLKAQGEYEDNLKVGTWKYFFTDGKIEQTGRYARGLPTGVWTWYYPNQQIRLEEEYINGLEDGMSTEYSDSGTVIAKGEYIDGYREGEWEFSINDLRVVGNYFEGERQGTWKNYYADTEKLQFEGNYESGQENGYHVYYWKNGNPRMRGRYVMGEKEGIWEYLSPSGQIELSIEYENGKEIKYNGERITYGKRIDRELEEEER